MSARASEAARTRTIEDSLHFARRSVFDELCGRRELLCVRRHVSLLSLPGTTPRARWRSRLKLSKLLGLQPRGCQAPQAAWKFSGLRKVKPHPPSLLQSSFPPRLSPLSLHLLSSLSPCPRFAMAEFIGAKISLISRSDIRYVGILHEINSEESTVALEQGTYRPSLCPCH
jgi:hypothetical protein